MASHSRAALLLVGGQALHQDPSPSRAVGGPQAAQGMRWEVRLTRHVGAVGLTSTGAN